MSLQVWLPLNGDLKNYGLASFDSATNNGATSVYTGKLGQCYSFNGSSNYLYYPASSSPINIKEYSLAFWIYSTSTTATQDIISCRTAVGSGISIFLISGKVRWDIGGNTIQWTTTYSYPANKWFHVAFTYDGTTAKMYVNGQYSQSYTTSAVSSTYLGNTVSFGSSQANGSGYGNYLNGRLNDIRIYDHCLSAKEVEEISKALTIHLKLDDQDEQYGNFNILTGTFENSYQTGGTSSTDRANGIWRGGSGGNGVFSVTEDNTVPVGKYSWNITGNTSGNRDFAQYKQPYNTNAVYTASFYAKGNGTCLWRSWDANGSAARQSKTWTLTSSWTRYSYTFTAIGTQQTNNCSYQVGLQGAGNIYLCGMKLEYGNTATAYNTAPGELGYGENIIYDCSGYRNNAIPYNTTLNTSSARYDKSVSFNGTNACVIIDNMQWQAEQLDNFTANVWINPTTFNGRIFSCTETGGFQLGYSTQDSTYLQVVIYTYTNAARTAKAYFNNYTAFKQSDIPTGQWSMLTVVYNNAQMVLYLNGEFYGTASSTTYGVAFNTSSRVVMMLGEEPGPNSAPVPSQGWYSGKISDFRLYNTELSASQIKELYDTSATIDNRGNVYARQFKEYGTVPSAYTRLGWLKSDGNQYINLGFYYDRNANFEVVMDVQTDYIQNVDEVFFGRYSGGWRAGMGVYNGQWGFAIGNWVYINVPADTNRHTFRLVKSESKGYIDNNSIALSTNTTASQSTSWYLFAYQGSTPPPQYSFRGKIYYFIVKNTE